MISETPLQRAPAATHADVAVDILSYAVAECALGRVLVARSGVCAILIGASYNELEADLAAGEDAPLAIIPRCSGWARLRSRSAGPSRRSFGMLVSVPLGDRITLGGAQRSRDLAHLLIDIVVARAASERIQLGFEIGGFLSFERRRAVFAPEWTVASGARGDGPNRTADHNQRRRIGWAAYL